MEPRESQNRTGQRRSKTLKPNRPKEHILVKAPDYTDELPAQQARTHPGENLVTLAAAASPQTKPHPPSLPHPSSRYSVPKTQSRPRRAALFFAAIYLGLLMAAVFILSGRIFDWSRTRVIASSPLNALTSSVQAVDEALGLSEGATALASSVEGFTRESYSGLGFGDTGQARTSVRPINILLLGTDARQSEWDAARTDSIILLSINPETHAVGMISLPRDLWVPIPSKEYATKINVAYIIGEDENYPGGGPQLIMDTVSSFIGRPIDYYARINFEGFVEIIDQLGGIDIAVPKTINDEKYPTDDYGVETFYLAAGQQHLDGDTALKYARTRNNDDDYARARRQQLVIQASIDRLTSTGMLPTLLPKVPSLVQTMRSSIDTNIRTSMILDLSQDMRDGSLEIVDQLVLDSRYGLETYSEEGAWILLPDREKIRVALEGFFDVVQAPAVDGIVRSQMDDAGWVRVEVLNGTGQPRVAALTRELLRANGWHVVSIDDADRSDYSNTLIVNYGAETELVEELSDTLGLADLPSLRLGRLRNSQDTPVDVRIVVGRDILTVLQ